MNNASNSGESEAWSRLRPSREALALSLKAVCDASVVTSVAGADNGVEADSNAHRLRRVLSHAEVPDEPSFNFVEALSLTSHREPEVDARSPSDIRGEHAGRALAIAALVLLAAAERADASELVTEREIAKLVLSIDVLGGDIRTAGVRTLAWAAVMGEKFGALSAHFAVGLAALAGGETSIDDAEFAAACLHAHELSERWRRPRHDKWCGGSMDDDDRRVWLDPLRGLLLRSLREGARRRGSEARVAAEMLADRLLGSAR